MPEQTNIVLTVTDEIEFFRLAQLKAVVKLEAKGIKVWSGRSAYSIAKERYCLKGTRAQVLEALEQLAKDSLEAKCT